MPRAPATTEQIARRRAAILDAAATELAERGYRGATIHRIARRAGLADGTVYNYFDSKEDLLTGLLERLQRLERRKLDLGTRPPGQLRALIEAWVERRLEPAWERADLLRALLPALLADADLRARYRTEVLEPSLEGVRKVLERLGDGGRIRRFDARTGARAVSALVLGLVLLKLLEDDGLPARAGALVEPVTELLLDGLNGP